MKRLLSGGFLATIGSVWTAFAILYTDARLDELTGWSEPPGEFITGAFECLAIIPLLIGLVMMIVGGCIMYQELRKP